MMRTKNTFPRWPVGPTMLSSITILENSEENAHRPIRSCAFGLGSWRVETEPLYGGMDKRVT